MSDILREVSKWRQFALGGLNPDIVRERAKFRQLLNGGNIVQEVAKWRQSVSLTTTDYPDPSNWTLLDEWDSRQGDLTYITGQQNFPRMYGFSWSYDGTRLHTCNTSDDRIYEFTCTTPFDPNTANAVTSVAVTNPTNLRWSDNGLSVYYIEIVGDEIQERSKVSGTPFSLTGMSLGSNITKSDVGFTGSADGCFIWDALDPTNFFWEGAISTARRLKRFTLSPAGDLDGFTEQQNVAAPGNLTVSVSQTSTVLSADKTKYYRIQSQSGVRLMTLSSPLDISSITVGALTDIDQQFANSWTIRDIWINPNDTSVVWVAGESGSGGVQFAKFSTGA